MDQIHPDDRARVMEASAKANIPDGANGWNIVFDTKTDPGAFLSLPLARFAARGRTEGLVIVNRDITERKRAEEQAGTPSFHDGLTNLPNRALFLDRLQRSSSLRAAT